MASQTRKRQDPGCSSQAGSGLEGEGCRSGGGAVVGHSPGDREPPAAAQDRAPCASEETTAPVAGKPGARKQSAHPSPTCANTAHSVRTGRADLEPLGGQAPRQAELRKIKALEVCVLPRAGTTCLLQLLSESLLDPLAWQGGGC